MFSPLIRKLGHGVDLTEADRDRLACLGRTRQIGARQDLTVEGDRPEEGFRTA